MAYEQKEGDIVIYAVKEKKNEKGPDWTGKALINGQEKDISLWIKGSTGTMLAGQIKEKFKPPFKKLHDDISRQADLHNEPIEDDSEIPF